MIYWLTSQNKKRHQRAINKLVREMNRNLERDELWCGRFMIRQDESLSGVYMKMAPALTSLYACVLLTVLLATIM